MQTVSVFEKVEEGDVQLLQDSPVVADVNPIFPLLTLLKPEYGVENKHYS